VSPVDGTNQSSWGGSVLWSAEDKLWYMFAAEMLLSCGLRAWACNSQVVVATSPSLDQRFIREGTLNFGRADSDSDGGGGGVLQPRFAHEPNVVRGPGGEWVIYFTGCDPNAKTGQPTACSPSFLDSTAALNCSVLGDGSTPPSMSVNKRRGGRSSDHTWMAIASKPSGPWSKPVVVLQGTGIDTNLSPVIFPNGSLLGLWRGGLNSTRPWSTIQRVTATNWKDPSTYKPEYDDLFPDVHSTE